MLPVKDTIEAMNIFDSICFQKGACFIKQLNFLLGRDILLEGCREYFKKFKYQNTQYKDFITCLQTAIDKKSIDFNVSNWADTWLMSAGANELEVDIKKDELNNRFKLVM